MANYLAKRLFFACLTVLGIILITFLLMKCVPGDPVYGLIGQRASPEIVEKYRKMIGAGGNYMSQFFNYLKLVSKGDLGRSYYTNYPVSRSIAEKFPNTLKLAVAAMGFAIAVGIFAGAISACSQNSPLDRGFLYLTSIAISTPVFWLGLILIFVFAYKLKVLPPSGMGCGDMRYLILPALTLGIRSSAYIGRVMRSSMIEVLSENYITAALAKGLPRAKVVAVHALRNAAIPVVTLIGIDFASYLNGAVLTETIFGWDGLGRFAMTAIFKRDYPVILGTVLFGAVVFVMINLLTDVIYKYLNPRIELEQ